MTPDGTVQVKKGEIADTITTGEDGVAVSKKLFLGSYLVKESKQPSGYVLEGKEYPVELKYKDEKTDLIMEELAVENKPTVIPALKGSGNRKSNGSVQFEIWKKNVPESGTEKEDHVIQTTDENGEIRIERFAPGTYCFQEHQTLPGYVLDETIHEVTISKDGTIDGKTVAVLKLKNVPTKLGENDGKGSGHPDPRSNPEKRNNTRRHRRISGSADRAGIHHQGNTDGQSNRKTASDQRKRSDSRNDLYSKREDWFRGCRLSVRCICIKRKTDRGL